MPTTSSAGNGKVNFGTESISHDTENTFQETVKQETDDLKEITGTQKSLDELAYSAGKPIRVEIKARIIHE